MKGKQYIYPSPLRTGSAVGIFYRIFYLLTTKYRYIMETLFIILFWVFALIGVISTLKFVVSLFRGRGGNNNGVDNKSATNVAPSDNGGAATSSTTPPPYNGGNKN